MARGERIFVEVGGQKYSLHAWALMNDCNPFTVLRRYHDGVTDPLEMLKKRAYRHVEKFPERTPEDLAETEKADLLKIAYASADQPDHWRIMCDLAGVHRKYAKRLKGVLYDNQG